MHIDSLILTNEHAKTCKVAHLDRQHKLSEHGDVCDDKPTTGPNITKKHRAQI